MFTSDCRWQRRLAIRYNVGFLEQNINKRRVWRNFIQRSLVVPIFIHSRLLLFEGNALLKCVYSGLMPLSIVFQSYHDSVSLLQGAQCGWVVPIFKHIIRDFPVPFSYVNGCGFHTKGLFSSRVYINNVI